jgi:ADP-ribose pyrophosphatase
MDVKGVSYPLGHPKFRFLKRGIIYDLPDGRQWDAVDYPTTFAAILPITEEKKLVFVEQLRFPAELRMYLLCGGAREPGETLEETAKREMLEESGYVSASLELLIPEFRLYAAANTGRANLYVGYDCVRVQDPTPDPVERLAGLRPIEFSLDEVNALLAAGDPRIDSTLHGVLNVLFARGVLSR